MRYFWRIAGSIEDWVAHASRVPVSASRRNNLFGEFAIARRDRQARETRVLPRFARYALIAVAAAVTLATSILCLPLPKSLQQPLTGTPVLLDDRGREIAEIATSEARAQIPVTLREMGPWLPRITVALEDHRFYEHGAADWRATAAAIARNLKSGRITSGGSTITQQLAKLARGRQHRSWLGKIYETIIAWKIERCWSKERILAEYLNRSSYGNRRLGPEAAARAYFGKSAGALTLAESIFVAGLPQAPTRFNPWTHGDLAKARYRRSVNRLAQLGVITNEQQQLLATSPPVVRRFDPPRLAPHFVDVIVARNPSLRGIVRTSLDLDLQTTAERMVRSHLDALNRYDISQAALVILDNDTGAVRAMVGSGDYAMHQINGAAQPRSAGSTLKPFVYLRALDRHLLTVASLLPDTADAIRDEYADYDPQNYNHRYLGPVRLREALGCSLNVPAVFTLSQLGARQTFFDLQKWGFDFPRQLSDYGAGFVLGNADIRLVDLAGAYAGLAREGVSMRAKFLAAEHHPVNRLASREATAIITDILCDNRAREKTFGMHSPLAFDERVAAKTGTSSGFRDAWTIGFDKEHTVAVWAGNFDGRPMRDTFAVRSATPHWAAMMHQLLARGDHPLNPLRENAQLVCCTVCADTGLLPSQFIKSTIDEWFLKGTEPKENSAGWFTSNGKLVLPNEYADWCASSNNTRGASIRSEARIISPLANSRYTFETALPRSQQMIELKTALVGNVEWFVNGVRLAAQPDGRFFWQLAPGQWNLRAVSRVGIAEETFTVEE
jgi:penicillin-binding protein 1C